METKQIIALSLMAAALPMGTVAAVFSRHARSAIFLAMILGTLFVQTLGINLFGRQWYRGTAMGWEVTVTDLCAWMLLGSLLLRYYSSRIRFFWPASLGFILFYFLWCAVSVGISDPKLFGLFELSKILRGILVFVATAWFIQSYAQLRLFVWAWILAIGIEFLLAVKMRYIDGLHRIPGTLSHPNTLSLYVCTVAPLFLAAAASNWSRWLRLGSFAALGAAAVLTILTISRAGIVTFAFTFILGTIAVLSIRLTWKHVAGACILLLLGMFVVIKSWDSLVSRYQNLDLEREYASEASRGRGYYIRLSFQMTHDHPMGVGLNNWSWYASNIYGPRNGFPFIPYESTDRPPDNEQVVRGLERPQDAPAHNLGALTLGELGWIGLLLFGLLWMRWFQMGAMFLFPRSNDPIRRMGVGCFFSVAAIFIHSFTEWVYRQSPCYFAIHIILGALAALTYFRKHAPRPAFSRSVANSRTRTSLPASQTLSARENLR